MKLGGSSLGHFIRLAGEKSAATGRQKYCVSCGTLIPSEAVYCPSCGVRQTSLERPEEATPRGRTAEVIIRNWRRIRRYLFFMSLGIFITAFLLGSAAPLTRLEAEAIVRQFRDMIGTRPTLLQIFRNNVILCLLFFIPGFGTAFMAFVGYSTGVVLSAVGIVSNPPSNALVLALVTLAMPWTWMEFAAYSLASTEGIMIVLAVISRSLRREVRTLLIVLCVTVALLVAGAAVEVLAIDIMTGG